MCTVRDIALEPQPRYSAEQGTDLFHVCLLTLTREQNKRMYSAAQPHPLQTYSVLLPDLTLKQGV